MQITSIFSFLVHPGKNVEEQPDIGGAKIPLQGKLFSMLSDVFVEALLDCKLDIMFKTTDQNNECRNDIINIIRKKDLSCARILAERLQKVTDGRSKLGLLFVVLGKRENTERIYLARFPADIGIIAEENKNSLNVELIERVFLKNAATYKAAVYEGQSFDSEFWVGKAIDKQVNDNSVSISGYCIKKFLLSDYVTTAVSGTRRLAKAIRKTIDSTSDIDIKEELTGAAMLAKTLNGKTVSMANFADLFGFSEKTKKALAATLDNPALQFDNFKFSMKEFSKHVKYRSVSIDNGAILSAPLDKFKKCFSQEPTGDKDNTYYFTTKGTIVNDQLRQSK
jgi:hypothetical protein